MYFESLEKDINSYNIETNTKFPFSYSDSNYNLKKLFSEIHYIRPASLIHPKEENDKSESSEEYSNILPIFPLLQNFTKISSEEESLYKENEELNLYTKISKESDSNKDHMLIEIPQEKSTESKTTNIRELIFKTVYPEKNNSLNKEKNDGKRKNKKDDILNKIGRHFFNQYLFNKNNFAIQNAGSNLYFNKFPQKFVLNAFKKKNRKIWNMKLIQIFETKNFYSSKDLVNLYYPNLKVINSLKSGKNKKIFEKSGIDNILNKKICDLYNEYLRTDEFKEDIVAIKINFGEKYAEKYKKFAEFFVGNFDD